MSKLKNPISFAGFAAKHNISRQDVQGYINSGRLSFVVIGDRKMIDLDLYADFKPDEVPIGRPITIEGLQRKVNVLEKKFDELQEAIASK